MLEISIVVIDSIIREHSCSFCKPVLAGNCTWKWITDRTVRLYSTVCSIGGLQKSEKSVEHWRKHNANKVKDLVCINVSGTTFRTTYANLDKHPMRVQQTGPTTN